jgi:hypothetical protein
MLLLLSLFSLALSDCYISSGTCYTLASCGDDCSDYYSCIGDCTRYTGGVEVCGADASKHYSVNYCSTYKIYYPCHSYCDNCTGSTASSCSRCAPGYYRGIFTGTTSTCYTSGNCPTGSFDQAGQIVCTQCDTGCYACSGVSSNCSNCVSPYWRDAWLFVCRYNNCLHDDNTTRGQYKVTGTQICGICFIGCATCRTSSSQSDCTMCRNGYYLWQQNQYTCATYCRNGSFTGSRYG